MLVLMWSRDQAVRDAVALSYKKLYLTTESTTPRAHAVQVVKNLSGLLKIVNVGQHAAFEELVKNWVKNGSIDKACIQVMWERFSLNIPDTSEEDSLAALILLGMVARAEVQTVSSNIPVLVSIGLGERGMRNYRLVKEACQVLLKLVVQKPPVNSPVPSLRFPKDHDIFTSIIKILKSGFWKVDENYYIPMSSEAIGVIYQLAEQPDVICQELLKDLLNQVKHGRPPEILGNNEIFDGLQGEHKDTCSEPNTHVSAECSFEVLSRFMFMIGHIALRQMLYLDVAVFCELKRRNMLREERDEALNTKSKKKKKQQSSRNNSLQNTSYVSMSASETPRSRQEPSDGDDEMGVVGAVADDQEAEYIRNICENDIVTGESLLAALSPLVVTICSNPNKYKNMKLQTAATLTLAKMMMVSSNFCENHLQLLVTVLEKATEPVTRCNLIVALGDLSYRFPNIIEPWTPHIYGRLQDSSSEVRQGTMLVLTNLIMNDMVKVKGQISEMALCIVDTEKKIADMACMFFMELSQKGNTLYNVMPDIISRLSTPDLKLEEEKFKTIMKFIMGLIQKDRQMESLVEKLCLRFRMSQSERQWSDLAFCLSLLQYSERSLRRLSENLPCYADKLHSPKVYETFCSILAGISKTTKPELKAAVDELEAKIKECSNKGADDVLVSQKATAAAGRRRTTANTPAGNRIGSTTHRQVSRSTVRRDRRRHLSSDSEDSDISDGENANKENRGSKGQSQQQIRTSSRLRSARKPVPPPHPVLDSDDSDEEIFVKPKTPIKKVTGVDHLADDAESSDEDVAENALASPDRKRICSSRDNKKISVTCTPKPRSTPRPKHTITTSASRSKTKNK
ncbi:hypothetical protein B7P43_G15860 [Cryptotermes secundus]|uniref:Condensin complex subunit 1 n=3 Tax=Cryptotermes secundus TaxID=105785 RepID=A0A2J7PH29_9NEOP|nr:hypothetical protein B7P43_G15860 [Cryptotermes secundus]